MKSNKLTEGSNLRWSTSFILPEHREAINRMQKQAKKKQKPELDSQKIESLVRTIGVAVFTSKEVTAVIYGEYEDRVIVGKIGDKIDTDRKRIRIVNELGYEWISFGDILELEINT